MNRIFKFFLNALPRPILIKLSYWLQPLLSFLYKGNNYIDPIDEKSYRTFLPYGYQSQRNNVLAPGTYSLERHRLLWLYLKNETDFFEKSLKVLHFAPEQAFYTRFKRLDNLNYITTDLNSPLADVKADICNLPFEENTFDVILCNHVLEHIDDDLRAMQELYRVMKIGGWGIFQIPQDLNRLKTFEDASITDKEERARVFGQYDHVRIYGLDYFERLKAVGFSVEQIKYQKKLSKEAIKKYAINPLEILPLVRKA